MVWGWYTGRWVSQPEEFQQTRDMERPHELQQKQMHQQTVLQKGHVVLVGMKMSHYCVLPIKKTYWPLLALLESRSGRKKKRKKGLKKDCHTVACSAKG